MSRLVLSPYRHLIGHQVAATLDREVAEASNALATGGTITTDTPTSVVHEFTAGDTFALSSPGILPVTVTISATGTFGGLSASGSIDIYADQTVTVTSGTVEVAYDPTEFVAISKTLVGWWDASDETSVTDAGGGAVSAVADKSGNGMTFSQADAGERPTTGASTLNGHNVIDFDGTEWLEQSSAANLKTLHRDKSHTFVVVRYGNTADPELLQTVLGSNGWGTSSVGIALGHETRSGIGDDALRVYITDGDQRTDFIGTDNRALANTWVIAEYILNPQHATPASRISYLVDGANQETGGTQSAGASWSPSTGNSTYAPQMGSHGNGGSALVGAVAWVLSVNTASGDLTSGERLAIRAFLSDKFGISVP